MDFSWSGKNALKSRAVGALLAFGALGVFFQAACAVTQFDRFEVARHGWAWWEVKGYKELPVVPDCVLFGSSLLQRLTNEGESTYLQCSVNAFTHNKSIHLEDNIKKQTGISLSTYAFAIGGMHASDATVIAEGLFQDKPPKTIIYAIAPRDFMDNLMVTPTETEPFSLMSHVCDLGELEARAHTTANEKFNYIINSIIAKLSPLAEYKYELDTMFGRSCRAAIAPSLRRALAGVEHPLLPGEVGIRVSPFDFDGQASINPEKTGGTRLSEENLLCYQCCYQPFHPRAYNTQMYFLRHLLQFARDRQINVILVNMPLRADNLNAMAPHFYDLYKKDVANIAGQCGAKYVDMFDTNEFKFADFTDTVHLSGIAAVKFVNKLCDRIGTDLASYVVQHRNAEHLAQTGSMQ